MPEHSSTSPKVPTPAHDDQSTRSGLVLVGDIGSGSPMEAVAHTVATGVGADNSLGSTTHVALRDPYLREQLRELHAHWEIRPQTRGLWGRIRTRLAWTLLGPELAQANRAHASLVRIVDSLIVHLDEERAARRRIEEHQAYNRDRS